MTPPRRLSASELRSWLRDGDELALLDAREQAAHAYEGHPLLAVSLPWNQVEHRAAELLPRKSARIVVFDGGDGVLAQRAAERLGRLGYGALHLLQGGVAGWRAAGYEVFTGTNVFSKVFGEVVEAVCSTPRISPAQLRHELAQQTDLLLIDSRPADEFQRMHIAGAVNCPAAELPYRFDDLVCSPRTTIVVTCAGRTRGILGTQALRNAGVVNEVAVLENGTMGWLLDGQTLLYGDTGMAAADAPSALARRGAVARTTALIRRFGISSIDAETLSAFASDAHRSLYVFDVRSPDEYAAGHLPGALSAPGTQLVMLLEDFVGVRHARVVLVDGPDASRAAVTASWLVQMGWAEVHVLSAATDLFTEKATPPADAPVGERWVSPYLLPDEAQRRQGFEDYLQWSAGLVTQFERDGTHTFRINSRAAVTEDALT